MTDALRIGVVGLGFGANHVRILGEMPGVHLVAVADRDPARLAPHAGTALKVYTAYQSMLAAETLDAVVVAVPATAHVPVTLDAIEAGCAVLVEKPLAPSLEDARRIADRAREKGAVLMPGHIERFNPAVTEGACRIQKGEIGRVLHVSARRMSATRAGPHGNRLPPKDVNVIHDSAIHDIDAMRYLLGEEVDSVFAASQTGVVTEAEDSVSAVLRFRGAGDNPPIGSIDASWLSQYRLRDLAVLGDQGSLLIDYDAQRLRMRASTESLLLEIPVQSHDQLQVELTAFVAAVRGDSLPPVTPDDGVAAVAIADALTKSARSGVPVSLTAVGV